MVFISRAAAGLPPLTGESTWTTAASNREGFAVHWDGGETPKTEAHERALLQAYDRYHRQNGFGGAIGYNLAVGPVTGNVYEARGLNKIGAHAGGANTANIGCIVIGGPGNLTPAAKRGLQEAYQLACNYTGKRLRQRVHSDLNSTGCPGDTIRNWVHNGGLLGSESSLGYNTTSRPTKDIQKFLKVEADGIYGDKTTAAVRNYQKVNGLVADGIWGPVTDAKAFPPKPAPKPVLDVDGALGPATFAQWRKVLGTPEKDPGNVELVKEVQRKLNHYGARDWDGKPLVVDGLGIGSNVGTRYPAAGRTRTLWSLQAYLGAEPDGFLDKDDSFGARQLQRRLNRGVF